MIRLIEAGVKIHDDNIKELMDKTLGRLISYNNNNEKEDEDNIVSISDFTRGVFIILICGHIFAIIVLIGERIIYPTAWRRKKYLKTSVRRRVNVSPYY